MIHVKNALISVSDKRNLIPLVKALHENNVVLYATNTTYKTIVREGFPCHKIEDYTGFSEFIHGRVKTLHPKVFGGILGRDRVSSEKEELQSQDIVKFQLVCVNLYPFHEHKTDSSAEDKLDLIDIGGNSLLRASAKNYLESITLCHPEQYDEVIASLTKNNGSVPVSLSEEYMITAFLHTSMYDAAIASSFSNKSISSLYLQKRMQLRYGENPHQKANFNLPILNSNEYLHPTQRPLGCSQLHGKELSYNNFLDASQGLDLLDELGDSPSCVILKHTSPCGVATSNSIEDAYEKAYACDPISAFGGVYLFNQEITEKIASHIHSIFVDVVCAPSFSKEALALLTKKKNVRLLERTSKSSLSWHLRDAGNGFLMQDKDREIFNKMEVVSGEPLTDELKKQIVFGLTSLKYVKSNAILVCKENQTLGIGGGQPNRVDSVRISLSHARERFSENVSGSILCSDAFFPFADSIEVAAEYGIKIIVEPGGSIHDREVIEAAEKFGITLVFTGQRHFLH